MPADSETLSLSLYIYTHIYIYIHIPNYICIYACIHTYIHTYIHKMSIYIYVQKVVSLRRGGSGSCAGTCEDGAVEHLGHKFGFGIQAWSGFAP